MRRNRAPAPVRQTYHQAQLAARARAGAVGQRALGTIAREMERWSAQLARELAGLPSGGESARRSAVEASHRIVQAAYRDLGQLLERVTAQARAASFEEISEIWRRASLSAAETANVPLALLGAVRVPPLSLVGVYGSLGSAAGHFATLVQGHVAEAANDLDTIITRGLLQEISPTKLSRAIRPYVTGAEDFYAAALKSGVPPSFDLRRVQDPALKAAAKRLTFNADRIAFSETHNARAEAEIQAFALDPLVEAILWELSPNRGRTNVPDVCDFIAGQNWYGRGKGVYPIRSVPHPPHPFDRCERSPVVRAYGQINDPKPDPERVLTAHAIDLGGALTQDQGSRMRDRLERLFGESHRSLPQVHALVSASAEAVNSGSILL